MALRMEEKAARAVCIFQTNLYGYIHALIHLGHQELGGQLTIAHMVYKNESPQLSTFILTKGSKKGAFRALIIFVCK